MTSILTDWGNRCIEKLIKGVIAEARFVFCLSCIANEFDEERARLKPEWETLKQRVKVAKRRNKDIQANVPSWEEEVERHFQEDTKENQTCFFGFCPDCIWRYKRGKKLANDTKEVKRLTEKVETFVNVELPRPPPGVERNSLQDFISLKSRESKYEDLFDALKDDNNFITGLEGMGGTGKTTLAKKVGTELKETGQFTYAIVTTVSSLPNVKKIQDAIAGPLGLELKDINESDRPGKLWDRLTEGEKILLILDDVWDKDPLDFDAIGIPKRGNHKGCRVLVTTRSKQLSNNMNFDQRIELDLLSDEDVWTMFKWYANISESSSKDVKNKGRKIAKECKELPVAIAVIASSLRGHHDRMEKWDATLTSLKKPVTLDGVQADLVEVFNCLKVSYDNMNDGEAKGLFRLCSLFPEDEVVPVEFLTRVSIGAGLFGEDYGSYNDARNKAVVVKNKLLDSCLLLEVDKNSVKMHDLIRDVAKWIASKEIWRVNLSDKIQKSLIERETNINCLLCEGKYMDLFFLKFDGSKLETLIAVEDGDEDYKCMEIPNSFFENSVNLRVLILIFSGNRSLSFSNSFQSLRNIRSLMVHMVDLGDISTLGNLQSLESLGLSECKINELPSEITNLKKFKLLSLEDCEIRMHNPFDVIEICSSLEELYFKDSFNDSCRQITLPELQRYHICIGGDEIYDSLSKYVALDEKVYGYFTKGTLKYFMKTAEALQLNKGNTNSGWKNLMPQMVPIEKGMNDLVGLDLEDDSELQCLIDTKNINSQVPNVVFSKLVALKLTEMDKLEQLCNGSISLDSFNNLEKLYIRSCQHLQSLFKCSLNLCNLKKLTINKCSTLISVFDLTTSQSLLKLETLIIVSCEQLKSIFTYERRGDDKMEDIVDGDNDNSKSYNSIMFPNLKLLRIRECHQLQFILPCHSAGDFFLLESIRIKKCDELKYIFGQHQDVQLASLKELDLRDVPNFINIFPESENSMPSSIKRSSNSISKTQTQLEPIKSNVCSWSHICCHSPTSTEISLVSEGQPKDFSISSVTSSHFHVNF